MLKKKVPYISGQSTQIRVADGAIYFFNPVPFRHDVCFPLSFYRLVLLETPTGLTGKKMGKSHFLTLFCTIPKDAIFCLQNNENNVLNINYMPGHSLPHVRIASL